MIPVIVFRNKWIFKYEDMDIFDFTVGEFQTLHRTPIKAKQYLFYIMSSQCVFERSSIERDYLINNFPIMAEKLAHEWDTHLASLPFIKATLHKVYEGGYFTKSEYNRLLRYIQAEIDILNSYHLNSSIYNKASCYTCFHRDEALYPMEFKISIAFTRDYESELSCFVKHTISNASEKVDFSTPLGVSAHTNLQSLIVYKEDTADTITSLKRDLPLSYILEHFCEFSLLHSLNSHTLSTIIDEQVADALDTIAFSYGLDCITKSIPSNLDDGINESTPKSYEILFKAKQGSIENQYINRMINCNNTLISSS